jgi:hypothetical protein
MCSRRVKVESTAFISMSVSNNNFYDVTLCSLVEFRRRFRETCYLCLQSLRYAKEATRKQQAHLFLGHLITCKIHNELTNYYYYYYYYYY